MTSEVIKICQYSITLLPFNLFFTVDLQTEKLQSKM